MRRGTHLTLVAFAGLIAGAAPAPAAAQSAGEQLKPYILLVLDISGSMDTATGSGPPTCGGEDTRLDHARCAIQKLVKTYGDVEFGFGRFRKTQKTGTCAGNCDGGGASCGSCNTSTGADCTSAMRSPDRFELLVPVHGESADDIEPWVNFSCGGCSYDPANDPEIWSSGGTPIGGSLRGARRYFQGNDTSYTADLQPIYGAAPKAPIANDPIKDVFVDGAQCRPYVTILLTDGEETCSMFDDGSRATDNDTIDAVAALLSTPVGGKNYRIETRPIGFGIADPDPQIEAMAAAGGGGAGLYAANETELAAAFNQIVLESLKLEVCDGDDNDCDGEVDEGFQLYCGSDGVIDECVDPGDDCDGIDDNCAFGTSDEPVNACGFCGPVPAESCNLLDDDCDGDVDEGGNGAPGSVCNGCVPTGQEICNNHDENCNGQVDEGLIRACGTDLGVCTAGQEHCDHGVWVGCTATGGGAEICNALDDDCDGSVNGIVAECYTGANHAGLPAPCQAGFKVCTATDTAFGACLGEVGPTGESCDGVDNNCNGSIDEGTGGADCDTQCGVGVYECQGAGGLVCVEIGGGCTDEVCDGVDNDGDDVIDEDVPSGGPCTEDDDGAPLCLPGTLECLGGEMSCVGGTPPSPDVCDCVDNDCDDETDEDPNGTLCPGGGACVECACRQPCDDSEFACASDELCVDGFCMPDLCFEIDCPPEGGVARVCVEGDCVAACDVATCTGGRVCRPSDGACVPDTCSFLPDKCADSEVCLAGACVANPCAGVDCPEDGEYCFEGACVASCSGVECPVGQACQLGECALDRCDGVACGRGRVCDPDTGECARDRCGGGACAAGEVCEPLTGDCVRDPCLGVECPDGERCTGGSCFPADQVLADGGLVDHDYVSAGGGGGCGVAAGGGLGALILAFGAAWLGGRRRRAGIDPEGGRSSRRGDRGGRRTR